jgi:hypothetical protein
MLVGNRVNRPERYVLLHHSAIRNRDQVDNLTLKVHKDHKKHVVTAINPDSLSNPRYSHNSDTHPFFSRLK